jgi:hypothetical protein
LIEWCERETEKLQESLDRQNRTFDRLEYVRQGVAEERREAESRRQHPTSAELKAQYGENWGLKSIEHKSRKRLIDSNRLFERVAANGGHDAGFGVVISPYLLASIRGPSADQDHKERTDQ